MAAAAQSPIEQRARKGRLRRFGPTVVQIAAAVSACTLWAGVASPGLKLLPGLDGLADDSISISLQSAVLGIDDGSNRPAEERARDAAAVLGLTFAESLLSPNAVRAGAVARADGSFSSPGVVLLGEVVAGELAATAVRAEPDEPAAPIVSAHSSTAPAAPAAEPRDSPGDRPRPVSTPPQAPGPPISVALPSSQTIEFTSNAPAHALVGGSYTTAASASSGLPVRLSIAESDVCRIAGSTVSFREAGTCVVEAHQAGSAKFKEARAQQAFTVGRAPQAIVFGSTPPAQAVAGGPAYAVVAVASSGLPVSFAAGAGSGGVCAVAGSTVSLVGPGTCVVEADQAGNGAFERAPRVRQSFAVRQAAVAPSPAPAAEQPSPVVRAPQTVTFVSTPPAGAIAGVTSYTVAAAATSGLPVELTVAQSSASVCAIAGATVTAIAAGTCTIEARQPGDQSFHPATQVQQSFAVGNPVPSLSDQTITFTSAPPAGATIGGAAYAVAASASSGLTVAFSASVGSAGVCSVSGSTVALTGAGTCTILADQAGAAGYHPAPQAQQSFSIGRASQAISFSTMPPVPAAVGGPDYTVAASASSALPVTFTVAPRAPVSARSRARRCRSSVRAPAPSSPTRAATPSSTRPIRCSSRSPSARGRRR